MACFKQKKHLSGENIKNTGIKNSPKLYKNVKKI